MKLVTAIMPTRGRTKWAAQAVECFLSQTYPNKDLLILDDLGEPSFPSWLTCFPVALIHPLVKVMWSKGRLSIAKKRNLLATHSTGQIIWTLDDDDWSAPERMADQVKRLEDTGKAMTGYHAIPFFDGEHGYRHVMHSSQLPNYAMGTSLCYLRTWALENPFMDDPKRIDQNTRLNVASDNDIVARAASQGQLASVACGGMMVARMHPGNSSSVKWTHRDESPSWRRFPAEQLPQGFLEREYASVA